MYVCTYFYANPFIHKTSRFEVKGDSSRPKVCHQAKSSSINRLIEQYVYLYMKKSTKMTSDNMCSYTIHTRKPK